MDTNAIFQNFRNLPLPDEEGRFNVVDLPGINHKLGISKEGYPIIFVTTTDSDFKKIMLKFDILSIESDIKCRLSTSSQPDDNQVYTIITLHSSNETLQMYFINIFVMVLHKLGNVISKFDLSLEIENLVSLFTAFSKPPRKKVQGLWAELLVIERSKDPKLLADSWHNIPNSTFDFVYGTDKIEVKSTSTDERVHQFSIDQLTPSSSSNLIIASVFVKDSAECESGISISGLFDMICQKISDNDLRIKIYSTIAETLGVDVDKINEIYFDYSVACDTLNFYDYRDVPRIKREDVVAFVSNVKFSSNLEHVPSILENDSSFSAKNSVLYNSLI